MTEPQRETAKGNDSLAEREEDRWRTKFPPAAQAGIHKEVVYLAVLFAVGLSFLVIIWWFPSILFDPASSPDLRQYALAGLGGMLGGTAFSMKWLYHAVGTLVVSEQWHQDRRLWRFLTPPISVLFALAFFALLQSGLLNIVIEQPSNAFAFAFGFIVGYFSDSAAAKMKDIAYSLFGKPESGR